MGVTRNYSLQFEGIIRFIEEQAREAKSRKIKRWAEDFMDKVPCGDCGGSRLNQIARNFRIAGQNIHEVSTRSIDGFAQWLEEAEAHLTGKQAVIAAEVFKELKARTGFMLNVGLNYLSLDRSAKPFPVEERNASDWPRRSVLNSPTCSTSLTSRALVPNGTTSG